MQRRAWGSSLLSGTLADAASKYFIKGATFWYEAMAAY
jgi:hypothetical protein